MPWGTQLIPVDELERLVAERRRPAKPRPAAVRRGRPRWLPDQVVGRVVAAHVAGQSLGQIARKLNADRVPTDRAVSIGGPRPSSRARPTDARPFNENTPPIDRRRAGFARGPDRRGPVGPLGAPVLRPASRPNRRNLEGQHWRTRETRSLQQTQGGSAPRTAPSMFVRAYPSHLTQANHAGLRNTPTCGMRPAGIRRAGC